MKFLKNKLKKKKCYSLAHFRSIFTYCPDCKQHPAFNQYDRDLRRELLHAFNAVFLDGGFIANTDGKPIKITKQEAAKWFFSCLNDLYKVIGETGGERADKMCKNFGYHIHNAFEPKTDEKPQQELK